MTNERESNENSRVGQTEVDRIAKTRRFEETLKHITYIQCSLIYDIIKVSRNRIDDVGEGVEQQKANGKDDSAVSDKLTLEEMTSQHSQRERMRKGGKICQTCYDVELVEGDATSTSKPRDKDRDTGDELLVAQDCDKSNDNLSRLSLLCRWLKLKISLDERATRLLESLQCIVVGARKKIEGQALIVVAPNNDSREPVSAE